MYGVNPMSPRRSILETFPALGPFLGHKKPAGFGPNNSLKWSSPEQACKLRGGRITLTRLESNGLLRVCNREPAEIRDALVLQCHGMNIWWGPLLTYYAWRSRPSVNDLYSASNRCLEIFPLRISSKSVSSLCPACIDVSPTI